PKAARRTAVWTSSSRACASNAPKTRQKTPLRRGFLFVTMERIDTLIFAAHVVPVAPRGVLHDHAVAIHEGRIVGIRPRQRAEAEFDAHEVVRLDRHVLMPGMVNLHCHAAMALMRGIADDVPLMTWLQQHI